MHTMALKPFWTHSDGETSWYRVHVLEKNYSVKVVESPFEEDAVVAEIKQEWSGGNSSTRQVHAGEEYDRVCAAFRAAKAKAE